MPRKTASRNRRKPVARKTAQVLSSAWARLTPSARAVVTAQLLLRDAAKVKAGGKSGLSLPVSSHLVAKFLNAAADAPGHELARAVAGEVWPLIEVIGDWALLFGELAKPESSPVLRQSATKTADQLDFALALIARRVVGLVQTRARDSRNCDLLCDAINMLTGNGTEAAFLIRRYQQIFPEKVQASDANLDDGGWPDHFAWDTYLRTEELDRLADEFPDDVEVAARQMHAWPMLWHRHRKRQDRFKKLAARLKLGAEYPLDASARAVFHPDTKMVKYLDPIVCRLYQLWVELRRLNAQRESGRSSVAGETSEIARIWHEWPEDPPVGAVVSVLAGCGKLPPLTKRTAGRWAKEVLVPLILANDARNFPNLKVPVLQLIAAQQGVKSRAIFVSRLTVSVKKTLKSMARSVVP